jgi:Family of unknown function (DUF6263)
MRHHRVGAAWAAFLGASVLGLVFPQAARAQVKLEYKFPEGQKLTYKTTTKTHQSLTIQGTELETDSDESVVESQSIGKRRGDSRLPIDYKVESLHVELMLPMGIGVAYDSTDPDVRIDNEQLMFLKDVFGLRSQLAYTVVLDKQNKVKEIQGTEKLLEKADKLDPKVRAALHNCAQADSLKRQFEQAHRNLPDGLAKSGEPWERTETMEVEGGQTFTFRQKLEYSATEKKAGKSLDVITSRTVDVKYGMLPTSPSPLKVTKSDLKIASSRGRILFDREEGRVVEADHRTRIRGRMTFTAEGQDLTGDVDLTIESNTRLLPTAGAVHSSGSPL